ncbi:hypothetical protein CDAR_35961 [Caerostris darwini]|uniref:Uncharacterized protein n=1 Tax=Caerostris darwini TaxID=1538125 RepID=A0AAV4VC93_9ARAC|nr:hypothetical protein CDAR_35961 [Caerostris darwini]
MDREVDYETLNHECSKEIKTVVKTEITKEIERKPNTEIKPKKSGEPSIPIREITRIRRIVPRKEKSRIGLLVLHKVEGTVSKLGSNKDVKLYYQAHNIKYDLTHFSGKKILIRVYQIKRKTESEAVTSDSSRKTFLII